MSGSRRLLIAIAMAMSCQSAALAEDAARFTRVRGFGTEMMRLVRDADARSATFRTLVDEIQRSNAIVVVQFGRYANGRIRSCVSHVGGEPGSVTSASSRIRGRSSIT
jgi:hypothetical protein